jgi:hypothetical protein
MGGFGFAEGDSVHGAGVVLAEVLTQSSATATYVQYRGFHWYELGQHGQGCAFLLGDVAQINVLVLRSMTHGPRL